jgi:hypothetical protein
MTSVEASSGLQDESGVYGRLDRAVGKVELYKAPGGPGPYGAKQHILAIFILKPKSSRLIF